MNRCSFPLNNSAIYLHAFLGFKKLMPRDVLAQVLGKTQRFNTQRFKNLICKIKTSLQKKIILF